MGRCERGSGEPGCDDFRADATYWEAPEHMALVSDFYLDTFEVTVGRFRKFVQAYTGAAPGQDAGAHPLIANSGWQTGWNTELPSTQEALIDNLDCHVPATWTDVAGANELYPIRCVNWYLAFAFCIWDGGRLPTEAEFEYAAAGGDANRLYPWGSEAPDGPPGRANHDGTAGTALVDVGSYPDGAGRWGHHDLAGSVNEWVFDFWQDDWYSGAGNICRNCANLIPADYRVIRSSAAGLSADYLHAVRRYYNPTYLYQNGIRCARTPQS
jgi:formylglycine-generating enzyme required for sulfatase activity